MILFHVHEPSGRPVWLRNRPERTSRLRRKDSVPGGSAGVSEDRDPSHPEPSPVGEVAEWNPASSPICEGAVVEDDRAFEVGFPDGEACESQDLDLDHQATPFAEGDFSWASSSVSELLDRIERDARLFPDREPTETAERAESEARDPIEAPVQPEASVPNLVARATARPDATGAPEAPQRRLGSARRATPVPASAPENERLEAVPAPPGRHPWSRPLGLTSESATATATTASLIEIEIEAEDEDEAPGVPPRSAEPEAASSAPEPGPTNREDATRPEPVAPRPGTARR
jgi:hypothetical protein